MTTTRVICGCGEPMVYDEPHPAEADTDNRELSEDVPLVMTGQGDYRRGWTPKLKTTGPMPTDKRNPDAHHRN